MAGEPRTNPTSLPPTPDGWRELQIEDLCERVTSGGTPSRQRPEFYENGLFNWFKTKELKDCALYDSEERITQDALDSSSAKLFPPDTVLMAMYGDGITITSLGILRRQAATNQACCAMIPKSTVCEPRFLFYSLLNHREDFIQIASGGAQRNLSGSLIRRFALNAPSLAEQKAIASILGALDDKIELNRRMNATLEAMARALFQSWFVDFDPVRAKLDDRQPTALDPATSALFPAHLVDSLLGHIPTGWEVKTVGDIGDVVCGKTPPTSVSDYYGADIPFITIPDMHGNVFGAATARKLSQAGAHSQAKKTLPSGSLCVSCIATPGLVVITSEDSQTNQQINSVIPRLKEETYFWYWVMTGLGVEIASSGSGGSVLVNLSKSRFEALQVIKPPHALIRAYHNAVSPLFETILATTHQSRTLATLRDTLLPKLLSGELRVTCAEKAISA
jgi:type I restriction enzyme, S subunit